MRGLGAKAAAADIARGLFRYIPPMKVFFSYRTQLEEAARNGQDRVREE